MQGVLTEIKEMIESIECNKCRDKKKLKFKMMEFPNEENVKKYGVLAANGACEGCGENLNIKLELGGRWKKVLNEYIEKSYDFTEEDGVRCLKCGVPFSESDIELLEEDQVPVCDSCVMDMCTVFVEYDGYTGLKPLLQKELKDSRCPHCYEEKSNVDLIEGGSSVSTHMKCSNCEITYIFNVHIKFV